MHETSEYYRYISLYNSDLDPLVYFLFHLSTIYLKLYIIFIEYICISKITTT